LTASATAPYATKRELNDMFTGFKEEIRLLLQGTQALSMRPAPPPMQYQTMGPNGLPYGYGIGNGYPPNLGHPPPLSLTEPPASKKPRAGSPILQNHSHSDGEFFDAPMVDTAIEHRENLPQAANTSLCLTETAPNPPMGGASVL
jgi:hypothetical protein